MTDTIDFMISAKELKTLLDDKKDVIVIDVRSKDEYNNGHIYCAVNFPEVFTYLPEGITSKKEKEEFVRFYEELFSNAGVLKDEIVVFYEDKFTLKSPRGLTILKYLGYDEKNIKVLDQGYLNWQNLNYETSTETLNNKKKNFIANVDEEFFVDYNDMLSFIDDSKVIKLDVRDKDEWIGISSSPYGIDFAPKKGRLPHATWIEWYYFITSNMMSVESLEKIKIELLKKNLKIDDDIVLYCFKGARLSNTYIALRKLGYKNIRIYFAGWNEWCRKENAPIINEVSHSDNPILLENIALKEQLDKIHLESAILIDFPKYNKEPIFSFDRDGNISFENKPKKNKLPSIKKFSDIFSDVDANDIHNMIDNALSRSITITSMYDKYFLLNCIGSREANRVLVYGFETTEINILNQNLSTQYNLVQNILDAVPSRIFWKDRDCVYLGANKLLLEDAELNYEGEIIGKTDFDLPWGETEAQKYIDDDKYIMDSGIPKINFEEVQTDSNGHTTSVLTSKVPLKDNSGNIVGILGSYVDITYLREMENKLHEQKAFLEYQAHHDALTGLPNRILFNDRLTQAIQKAKRENTKIALLFIDLDHFKEINDSLGHDVGDELLIAVTQKLRETIRKNDTISRFGGDEFTIIIENLLHSQEATPLAAKIVKSLAEPITINNNILYVSSSIGISIYPDDGDKPINLLKYSDAAMYKAKAEGRSNFQYYSSEMTELAFERVVMETSLRTSLKNKDFLVYYQAQVDGRTNKIIGMEALVRWRHPTMGIVSPSKFISLAESTGLIVELDRFVMKTAINQFDLWTKDSLNPGILAMNLSIKQLQKKDFIDTFKEICKNSSCSASCLELEVTESQIMTNPEEAIKTLNEINNMGVSLAIDDFGTGYSSLSYLKKLPISKLKIDQTFVRGLPRNEDDKTITNAIIALAKSLNLKVIAEGVETKEQKDFLVENGCESIQGYYYAEPLTAKDMEATLRKGFDVNM